MHTQVVIELWFRNGAPEHCAGVGRFGAQDGIDEGLQFIQQQSALEVLQAILADLWCQEVGHGLCEA